MNGVWRKTFFIHTDCHDRSSYKLHGLCVLSRKPDAFDDECIFMTIQQRWFCHPHFTDWKLISQRLSDLPGTTQLLWVQQNSSLFSKSMHT